MGRNANWLNEKQVDVLRWVRDGCPTVDAAEDYGRRITARALHNRGLIAITGRGPSWTAALTELGRARLESYPGPPPDDAEVEALIDQVRAAEGPLVLPEGPDVRARYEELVRRSQQSAHRPVGWRLDLRTVGRWDAPRRQSDGAWHPRQEVVLIRRFEDLVEETPVPVRERVAAYHPIVKAYLADGHAQLVSREHLSRAARILQAIVDEAPRRGLAVMTKEQGLVGADSWRQREIERSHLVVRSAAGPYGVRIYEASASGGRVLPLRGWYDQPRRLRWQDLRTTEFISTGVLGLVVEGPGAGSSGDRYRDTPTIPLEQRLPRLFRTIELHRLYDEHRAEERRREAAGRQRRWAEAMGEARRRYDEQARWEDFTRRARHWRETTERRVFLSAVREAINGCDGPWRDELNAHLDAVERRLDASDPLLHPELVVPDLPHPKPDDLRPFLDGWSPHGPEPMGW